MWLTCPWHVVECSKKANPEVELVTDIDMLLMAKKEIIGGMCFGIHKHAEANDKYMKDCDRNKKFSNQTFWGVNNLYCWTKVAC